MCDDVSAICFVCSDAVLFCDGGDYDDFFQGGGR